MSEFERGSVKPKEARRESHTIASGVLLALAATPSILLAPGRSPGFGPSPEIAAASGCGLLLLAALVIFHSPLLGRLLATVSVVGTLALFFPSWDSSPGATLVVLILVSWGMLMLWKVPMTMMVLHLAPPVSGTGYLRGAVLTAVSCWIVWVLSGALPEFIYALPLLWSSAVAIVFAIVRTLSRFKQQRQKATLLLVFYALVAAVSFFLRERLFWCSTFLATVALLSGLFLRRKQSVLLEQASWWEPLLGHPERLFVGTFAGISLLGGLLLSTPAVIRSGQLLTGLDALFLSTSAVCVTGLATVDTSAVLSSFGQAVLLLLIQVGGLGIMTFSTAVLWVLGARMSLRHEGAVASLISTHDRGQLFATAQKVLLFTCVVEGAGALLLAAFFRMEGDGLGQALWRGIFTSISAFCNAGFSLQSDSLVGYQSSPLILHTVAVLIILGGLSPMVAFALPQIVTRSVRPVFAQAKLALVMTVLLLVTGFFFFLAFEWQSSLSHLSLSDKLHNAWFQSATLRTAGFNSVDLAVITPPTLTFCLIWMFIGGSPGSTAGGVKTTTIAVLCLSVLQAIRGKASLEVFGKLIPEKTRARAAVVVMIAATTGLIALFSVQLTQPMSSAVGLFEVVSALGTVGLTIGGTALLDSVGKIIIIACMFVGRVGGLSLLMFLSTRTYVPKIGRPVEEIDVG